MRTYRWILGLLLALSAIPAAAHAQDPQQRIEAARRRAQGAGIPVALLDSKVAEGRAKGVPMDRIATAVERRLVTLSQAREAMSGASVTAAELSVGADALEAGVDARVLGQLAAAAPASQRAVAIAILTQLVSNGLSSERALARVQSAMAQGPEALRRLPGEAASERGRGGSPPGRGQGRGRGNDNAGGRGRGQGGPPASVPGPTERPKGRGHGHGRP